MLLYEHFLNDYIDFKKKRHDKKNPSNDNENENKNQFTYKEKMEAFFSDAGLSCVPFFFILILALSILLFTITFIWACLLSLLIEFGLLYVLILKYDPNLKKIRRENTNRYIEDFISFIYDTQQNYSWYIEDHIDDLISWCSEKSQKNPSWYTDLHLPENPIWSFIMAAGGYALALIRSGANNSILIGIIIMTILVILYTLIYAFKDLIYAFVFPHKVAAKELADDLKCAKLVLAAKEKGKHTGSNKN